MSCCFSEGGLASSEVVLWSPELSGLRDESLGLYYRCRTPEVSLGHLRNCLGLPQLRLGSLIWVRIPYFGSEAFKLILRLTVVLSEDV